MRVAFVYPNPRESLLDRVAAGTAPDTNLYGQNHLSALGLDAVVRDSVLRRGHLSGGLRHRVTWHARELTLPFELRDADLVVTPLAALLPLVARAARRPKVLVVSYHLVAALDRSGRAQRSLLRSSLRASAGVVAISRAGREALLSRVSLRPERVFVAELGVDARWWRPAEQRPDGYVLTVGRDLARDYETFARAIEGLDVRGVIVAKEENLRNVVVPPNVEVRLNISPDEVRTAYAGASCVVVPTYPTDDARGTENSGTIALLEAMACARPTIVTRRTYLDDYVDESATRVVESGDANGLREAISGLTGDPARQASMGAAGRKLVEARFTTELLARRLAAIIQQVTA